MAGIFFLVCAKKPLGLGKDIGFFFPRISDFSSHARKNKRGKKMCEKEESEKKTKKSEEKASISRIFKLCE